MIPYNAVVSHTKVIFCNYRFHTTIKPARYEFSVGYVQTNRTISQEFTVNLSIIKSEKITIRHNKRYCQLTTVVMPNKYTQTFSPVTKR